MASPVPANSPLLNPNQALSGQSLLTAAQGLVNAQTAGPLAELARQIASNNSQGQAAVNQVGGFYNQLGQQAQSGANQVNAIGTGLNNQLGQIASDTQGQLGQIGQNASASLLKYAPQSDASNSLAQPAMQSLTQELARQQGLAAQSQGAFRAFGANQGANYGGLAASNLGTFALKGQEGLKSIAQAGQLKNEPLMSKVANMQAARGSDLQTAIGKLRQAEVNNQIAKQGLGIKQDAVAATINDSIRTNQTSLANNLLTNQTSAANNASTNATSTANNLLTNQTSAANNAANNAVKQAIANVKTGGGTKPLSTLDNTKALTSLNKIQNIIQAWQQGGMKNSKGQVVNPHPTAAQIRQVLGSANYDPTLIEAAFELLGYGSITQSTAAALHQGGIRGGTFRNQPIRVTANYNPNNPRQNPPNRSIAGQVGSAVKSLGNIFG